jgi:CMP-N-acetylneuraminic acid synthetase
MKPKVIALLPMKGNSERVPKKNLKNFNGTPLYQIILNKLLESKIIDEVIVNTDCPNITESIQSKYKEQVLVRNRPDSIRGDFVSMNKIIENDLDNSDGEIYIQTHSTNPLLDVISIDRALNKMLEISTSNDSIFSVTKIQTRFYDINGKAINHNPQELVRTQDLPPIFEENSCFYIFTKNSFKQSGGKRIGLRPLMFEIDKIEAIDIDNIEDFIIAEAVHKSRQSL